MGAIGYEFLPTLRATVEYHHYFDKKARMADNKQELLSGDTNEYLAGIEWDAHKYITLSAGYQNTDYGLSDEFQTDTSFYCDSYSLGFGARINFNQAWSLDVAYFWTNYKDYTKESANYNGLPFAGTDVYSRSNKTFGLSLNYKF